MYKKRHRTSANITIDNKKNVKYDNIMKCNRLHKCDEEDKKTFKKVDSMVAWIEDIVSGTSLAAVVIIAAASVFGRYVLHTGILWADEVNQMLLVAMGMFGSARAVRFNGHTEFTSFINNRKSRKMRILLRAIINILAIMALIFMFLISVQFASKGTMKSTVLKVPRMYFYISIPIGFGLCIYEYLKVLKIRILTDIKSENE